MRLGSIVSAFVMLALFVLGCVQAYVGYCASIVGANVEAVILYLCASVSSGFGLYGFGMEMYWG